VAPWHDDRVKTSPNAKKIAPKKTASEAKKTAAKAKKTAAKAAPRGRAPAKKFGTRADLGAPVDGFFAKQPQHLVPILEALRSLVDEAAPDATAAIKWGMPFYSVGPGMMCALAGFKGHVNLILPGPPGTYADPDGLLEGDGKTGRHIKLRSLDELPSKVVRGWLRTAAERARKGISPR
jgi:hypothetical protein